jgi:Major tropism determinant N-terminal domain
MPRLCTRRGTAHQWFIANPVLAENEVGYEYDTTKYKLGNGIDRWSDLNYSSGEDGLFGNSGNDLSAYALLDDITQDIVASTFAVYDIPAGLNRVIEVVDGEFLVGGNLFISATDISNSYQPKDADLTALAALTGTNTIYYRSAANTWTAVVVGSGLSFSGGTLAASGGGGDAYVANTLDQFADVTQTAGQTLAITSSTTLAGGTHSGTNTGDQTITLTGVVTGTGNGSFTTSLGSFTKSQLDTAVSDGNVVYVGDALNGTIGATTPAAGTFTTIVANAATSILVGTAGSAVGSVGFRNATSGTITLQPTTGALGTTTITMPAFTGTAVVAATSTTTTQALFATATAGAPAFRAIAAGDIPTLNQNTTGSAATLTTPRNIGGTSFNGSVDITPANTIVASESSDTTCFVTFVTDATGNLPQKTNASLTFNSVTATLSCTTFVGAFTGTASGNLPLAGGTLSGGIKHTETVNTITANASTITLGNSNHQTLDLASATGDVAITLTVPPSSSAGSIIIKQDNPARNIVFSVSSGTIMWMGVQPPWYMDASSSVRILSWRYDGSVTYLAATEVGI